MAKRATTPKSVVVPPGGVNFRLNDGIPDEASSYGLSRFLDLEGTVENRLHGDAEIPALIASGEIVQYVGVDGRVFAASVIGENVAINLFIGGAAEIEDPVVNGDEARTARAISPVMAILLGQPSTPGVVDFRCAGMLWALTGYALRKEYMYERSFEDDAKRLFAGAIAAEANQGRIDPALTYGAV